MEWDELRGIRQGLMKKMDIYQLAIVYAGLTNDNIPTKPEWMVN